MDFLELTQAAYKAGLPISVIALGGFIVWIITCNRKEREQQNQRHEDLTNKVIQALKHNTEVMSKNTTLIETLIKIKR